MQNKVFVNDQGIIEIHVIGDQTLDSVQAMGDEAVRLSTQLREQHQRVLVLDDLRQVTTVPVEARKLVTAIIKWANFDKLAILGSGTFIKLGANLMLHATGRGEAVQYFDDKDLALAWLQA